jgi:hypothetical protein
LKDPSSAQYRNVMAVNDVQFYVFCGEVNAKNSFGAYTGYRSLSVKRHKSKFQPVRTGCREAAA